MHEHGGSGIGEHFGGHLVGDGCVNVVVNVVGRLTNARGRSTRDPERSSRLCLLYQYDWLLLLLLLLNWLLLLLLFFDLFHLFGRCLTHLNDLVLALGHSIRL